MTERLDYISQMVQDTFESLDGGDLLPFGDKKTESSEQLEMDLNPLQARFDAKRLCLVFSFNAKELEIPVNWGPFQWCDFNSLDENFDFFLEKYQDTDHLLDIFSQILNMEVQNMHLTWEANMFHVRFNNSEDQKLAA